MVFPRAARACARGDQNLKEYDVSDNTTGASSVVMRADGTAILLANGHGTLYVP